MTNDPICSCPKCGRQHRQLGDPPWRRDAMEIKQRIARTICPTFRAGIETMEGRISVADFTRLMQIIGALDG